MGQFPQEFFRLVDGEVLISPAQASRFAKDVAGDWNPIHDEGAKRFCVPGDLLFAIVLSRYGLSPSMQFTFTGMVGENQPLILPEAPDSVIEVKDGNGKVYMRVERQGTPVNDPAIVEGFVRRYVAFSGRNFPHYLKPLMAEHGVMFNPDRPMVIYDSMGFELDLSDADHLDLEFAHAELDVRGRRGSARLDFSVSAAGQPLGAGSKTLTISGLQPYDEERLQAFIADFTQRIEAYRRTR